MAPGAFPEILLEPACSSDWQEQQDLSVLEVDQQQHVDSVLGNRAEVQYELDSLFGDTQATRGFARVKSDDLDWNMSLQGNA